MEIHNKDDLAIQNQNTHRELQNHEESNRQLEVPAVGQDDLKRVTKTSEPFDLSDSLRDDSSNENQQQCGKPGIPLPSVDNFDKTGIDCTRDPNWEVISNDTLDEEPTPENVHNDMYWDERSLSRQVSERDLQDELIEENQSDSIQHTLDADEFSRPYLNETLNPYYNSAVDFDHHHDR